MKVLQIQLQEQDGPVILRRRSERESSIPRDDLTRLERAVDQRHFEAVQRLLDEGRLPRSVVRVGHGGGATMFRVNSLGKVGP